MIGNTNLNINSWLIDCGLLQGYLSNGMIKTTKFGNVKRWTAFIISSK